MDDAHSSGAVNARIVYWGAEGAGKRTNLRVIHAKLRPDHRGELKFNPTRLDPTLHYGTLPIELGEVGGIRTRIQIVSMPGEAEAAPSRKQLLDRADGVVFVLDARREKLADNLASFEELKGALAAYGRTVAEMPLVMQYNKRDLADPFAMEELHRKLSLRGVAAFEAVAKDGTGVLQTLTTISKRVIRQLREQPAAPGAKPAPSTKPGDASPLATTQVRLGPALSAKPAPPPGVTQLIDRAAFEASLPRSAPERTVNPEESQPGYDAAPATFADAAAQAESLFAAPFESAKRAAAPAPRAAVSVSAEEGDLALAIEPAGPALPAPGGLRIPLFVRDANGKRRKLTLSLRFESEDA
jgi:hypothetical protein